MKKFRQSIRVIALKDFDDTYEEFGTDDAGAKKRIYLNRVSMKVSDGIQNLDEGQAAHLIKEQKIRQVQADEPKPEKVEV